MTAFLVAIDWGTTHFRLRLVDADRSDMVAEVATDEGTASLANARTMPERGKAFREVVQRALDALGDALRQCAKPPPVLVSGMASSSIGWQELPYGDVPWSLDGRDMITRELDPVRSQAGTHRVILLSGVRTRDDVLRGEETQLLGLFQLPRFGPLSQRCVVVLPGTHSKHLHVADGALADFRTFMTGELFDIMSCQSILRHSVGAVESNALGPNSKDAFLAGVRIAAELPLASALFRVRTNQLLHGSSSEESRSRLSGILIGGELGSLYGALGENVPIVLCATQPLVVAYRWAAVELGLGDRLQEVPKADFERLSALGQACVARRLSVL